MNNHWQVIEDALTDRRSGLEFDEERMHIDAAIAFVREMRQRPPVPEDVRETIKIVLTFARRDDETAAYINPRVDKALTWLDSAGAEK